MRTDNINPVAVGKALVTILQVEFPHFDPSKDPSHEEIQIAEHLFQKFAKVIDKYEFVTEHENFELGDDTTTVDTMDQPHQFHPMDCQAAEDNKENDPDWSEAITPRRPDVSIKTKAKIIQLIDSHPNWSFKTINNKYPCYAHRNYYNVWKQQIQNGGTRAEILYEIEKSTIKMFREVRESFKFVNDIDIRRWALQRASEFPNFNKQFLASSTWIQDFKKRNRISSRKVTKLVSKRNIGALQDIMNNVEIFRSEIQLLQPKFKLSCVWNTDQIGFNEEYARTRTLSFTNEGITFGAAFSPQNKITHSYSTQLIISAEGRIVGPLYICLQEQNGQFGEIVKANIFKAPNIVVTCTKSGKLTSNSSKYFFETVAKPNIKGDVLYVLDSFGAQTKLDSYEDVGEGNSITVKVTPKNGTQFAQPLDVYFNRQYKYFVRRFYSHANLIDRNTGKRNDILKMQSLSHFVLSAPVFEDMIRYSWIKSGLVKLEKKYFENVRDACFNFKDTECKYMDCSRRPFIQCSWCKVVMCFECFFDDYHPQHCKNGPIYFRENSSEG